MSEVPPVRHGGSAKGALIWRFECEYRDVKYRVSTTAGDLRRARAQLRADGLPDLDEMLRAKHGTADAMEMVTIMAWLAMRHEDGLGELELEVFGDHCSDITILMHSEDPVRPTVAGPSNG